MIAGKIAKAITRLPDFLKPVRKSGNLECGNIIIEPCGNITTLETYPQVID